MTQLPGAVRKPALTALIFDVDGTLADTEHAHLRAFNEAFAADGLDWYWDMPRYTRLLEISGGKERMLHYWRSVQPGLRDIQDAGVRDTLDRLHLRKTAAYEQLVHAGAVSPRPGVLALIEEARGAGMQLAIATTTSPANIAALLGTALGADWRAGFAVIEDAATAPQKKPHPQVYRQALARLGLAADACLAFEDSANGLAAARATGLDTVITPNAFTAHHTFDGALRCVPSLAGIGMAELRAWHQGAGARGAAV